MDPYSSGTLAGVATLSLNRTAPYIADPMYFFFFNASDAVTVTVAPLASLAAVTACATPDADLLGFRVVALFELTSTVANSTVIVDVSRPNDHYYRTSRRAYLCYGPHWTTTDSVCTTLGHPTLTSLSLGGTLGTRFPVCHTTPYVLVESTSDNAICLYGYYGCDCDHISAPQDRWGYWGLMLPGIFIIGAFVVSFLPASTIYYGYQKVTERVTGKEPDSNMDIDMGEDVIEVKSGTACCCCSCPAACTPVGILFQRTWFVLAIGVTMVSMALMNYRQGGTRYVSSAAFPRTIDGQATFLYWCNLGAIAYVWGIVLFQVFLEMCFLWKDIKITFGSFSNTWIRWFLYTVFVRGAWWCAVAAYSYQMSDTVGFNTSIAAGVITLFFALMQAFCLCDVKSATGCIVFLSFLDAFFMIITTIITLAWLPCQKV